MPNGKAFVVNAKTNGPQRPYIRSASLNGTDFNSTFLQHPQIAGGGEVTFEMTSAPDNSWATEPESRAKSAMGNSIGGR